MSMLCCQPSMDGFPARDKRALLAQFDLRINYGALINFKTGSVSHELILMKLKVSIGFGRSSALFISRSKPSIVSSCDVSSSMSQAVFLHKTAAVITACACASHPNRRNGGAVHTEFSPSHSLRIKSCSSQGNVGSVIVDSGGWFHLHPQTRLFVVAIPPLTLCQSPRSCLASDGFF